MRRPRVAVLFGGCSEEHGVSVKSAQQVARHVDRSRYEAFFVGITRRGEWRLCDAPGAAWESGTSRPAVLLPDPNLHGLQVTFEDGRSETIGIDVVFPVLHGKSGEDGAVQGLLELSGIPYVGCGIQASALCIDKSLTYLIARSAGMATPEFRTLSDDAPTDPEGIEYPVFVKPARSGSSFGVSRVDRAAELEPAVAGARRFDSKVLIEQAVEGAEIGCAILGNGSQLFVGQPDRVALTNGFFRIHQETRPESGSENAEFIVPADIPPAAHRRIRESATTLYRAVGCRGLARVDFFLTHDGSVVLNEINTMPGLTSYSRYPRMMAASGMSMTDVIGRLIALALEER